MSLQETFIANLKKIRKERGLSQMALSGKCDTTSNYIGQIEMGRRIPSFDKIEQIAAALEVDSSKLFAHIDGKRPVEPEPTTGEYLRKLPAKVKREIISNLLAAIGKDVRSALDSQRY